MKTKKILLVVLLIILICFVIFAMYQLIQESRRATIFGTVSAIGAVLSSELNKGNTVIEEMFHPISQEWRFVTAEEYDKIITELAKTNNLDIPEGWNLGSPLLDFWGNRLMIGYRKLPDKEHYDFIVISKGPDEIFQTKDDVSRDQYK